jgi:hypothetical protein
MPTSTNNHFQFSSAAEPFIYHPSSINGNSPRSSSHLFDNYNQQRQISSSFIHQQFNPSISTRTQAGLN